MIEFVNFSNAGQIVHLRADCIVGVGYCIDTAGSIVDTDGGHTYHVEDSVSTVLTLVREALDRQDAAVQAQRVQAGQAVIGHAHSHPGSPHLAMPWGPPQPGDPATASPPDDGIPF